MDAAGRKHVVVVARDSMELRECREQYRAIFEATTEAMLVFDSHGIVVEANYTASKLFGYPKEEILGLEGKDLVDPKHYDILHDFQKQLELDIDKEFLICTMSRRSDGTILEVEVRATKFIFRGKKSLLVIVNDVTERKKMERDLLRSQQLDTLGVLAGGIAHDFNNMLTVISMAISMTRMVCSDDERVRRNLDQASRATEIARQQTLRLLTFAKGG